MRRWQIIAVVACALIWLGQTPSSIALACGIGQPFTMVANTMRALAFPLAAQTSATSPLGVFPLAVPVGQTITFSEDTSGAPSSFDPTAYRWIWDFGDGQTTEGERPAHTFTQAGTVVVRVILVERANPAQRTDPFDSAELTITPRAFSDPPSARVRASATYVAAGGSVAYDATGSAALAGGDLRYQWNFGDGATATGPQVTHRFTQIGSGSVALIVTDQRGAQAVALAPVVVVLQLPQAAIQLPAHPTAGSALTFSGAASTAPPAPGDHIVDYLWDFGDGQQAESPTARMAHTYTRPGDYVVMLQITDAQGLPSTIQERITVAPAQSASSGNVTLFSWLGLGAVALGAALYGLWRGKGVAQANHEARVYSSFRTYSATSTPRALENPESSPIMAKPHFARTRREP